MTTQRQLRGALNEAKRQLRDPSTIDIQGIPVSTTRIRGQRKWYGRRPTIGELRVSMDTRGVTRTFGFRTRPNTATVTVTGHELDGRGKAGTKPVYKSEPIIIVSEGTPLKGVNKEVAENAILRLEAEASARIRVGHGLGNRAKR